MPAPGTLFEAVVLALIMGRSGILGKLVMLKRTMRDSDLTGLE